MVNDDRSTITSTVLLGFALSVSSWSACAFDLLSATEGPFHGADSYEDLAWRIKRVQGDRLLPRLSASKSIVQCPDRGLDDSHSYTDVWSFVLGQTFVHRTYLLSNEPPL